MEWWAWLIVAAAVVIVVVVVISVARTTSTRRRTHLQDRFGTEYDRTVESADSRRDAERELKEREARRSDLDIHPLSTAARERYQAEWDRVQAGFVDRPQVAVHDADAIVSQLMSEMGYPMDEFDTNAALLSVDHSNVVDSYRKGHAISEKTVGGGVSTEELRQGVVAYRALFEELMHEGAGAEGSQ